ncbi:MAG: hypothetical protein NVS4B1_23000 [Ktedonobacteraceae bacterium]
MPRRVRSRKALILPIIGALLCIFLSAFTFSQFVAAHNTHLGTLDASSHKKRPHPTTTPIRRHTPTPYAGTTPTVGVTATVGTTPTSTSTPVSQLLQLFVEPDAGETPILHGINNAQKSVWLEMYLMTDQNVIQALENDAKRGLDVRVMLEAHPYGGGSPQATLDALNAAGAKAQISNPSFTYTHEKGMIIDGSTAYIMTSNFTFSAISAGKNREYGIIDSTPQDVQGTVDIFNADWNRTAEHVTDPSLVISPDNSRNDFVTFINNATSSLIIEAEEMQDSTVEQAIASAAQRGVNVQVILPTPPSGSTDYNAAGIAAIKAGGAQVKEDPQLVMHAKMMVADGTNAYVGSINISSNSFDNNRELGVIFSDQGIISTLNQTFQNDWGVSKSQNEWGLFF